MTTETERALLELYSKLSEIDKAHLVSYANYLESTGSAPSDSTRSLTPKFERGPDNETVVSAVRRLRKIYFMLDPRTLLGEVGEIITRCSVENGAVPEAITALEEVFSRHFDEYKSRQAATSSSASPLSEK